jgi:hypothetical protein
LNNSLVFIFSFLQSSPPEDFHHNSQLRIHLLVVKFIHFFTIRAAYPSVLALLSSTSLVTPKPTLAERLLHVIGIDKRRLLSTYSSVYAATVQQALAEIPGLIDTTRSLPGNDMFFMAHFGANFVGEFGKDIFDMFDNLEATR